MACRLLGDKPLPKPVVTYQQLDPYVQKFDEIWSKI